MSYNEDEEGEVDFKGGVDEDEPLDMPETMNDFEMDEDPDKDK